MAAKTPFDVDDEVVRPELTGGRVVLVTLDGVRWQDVFFGIDPRFRPDAHDAHEPTMPKTVALAQARGVMIGEGGAGCGVVRTAGGANVSLPGYIEIFTGRPTACRDNHCARVDTPTVLDEVASAANGTATSVSSWEGIAWAAASADGAVVSAGQLPWRGPRPSSRALDELLRVSALVEPFPGYAEYRPDGFTMRIALEVMRARQPTLMHVGLGDTDEWAHRGDYAAYLAALRSADDFIGEVADLLDVTGEASRTTVIVTSDHGRSYDLKQHGESYLGSERSFVIVFGPGIAPRAKVCPDGDVTLLDIAPTVRELVGLDRDLSGVAGRPIAEALPRQRFAGVVGAGGAGGDVAPGAPGASGGAGGVHRP